MYIDACCQYQLSLVHIQSIVFTMLDQCNIIYMRLTSAEDDSGAECRGRFGRRQQCRRRLHILVFVLSMPNTGIGMGMSVVIMLHIVSCVAQSPARSVIFSHVLPSIPHRHGLNQSRIMKRRWRLRKNERRRK